MTAPELEREPELEDRHPLSEATGCVVVVAAGLLLWAVAAFLILLAAEVGVMVARWFS